MAVVRRRSRCSRVIVVRHGGEVLRSPFSRSPPAKGGETQFIRHRFTPITCVAGRTVKKDHTDGITTVVSRNVSSRIPVIK